MDDYSYSKGLEQRAVARRAAQANGQALSEKVAELAYARPVADAAHAVAEMWATFRGTGTARELMQEWDALGHGLDVLLAAHLATTPSAVPSSHVIVERVELERLRAVERLVLSLLDGGRFDDALPHSADELRAVLNGGM